MYLLVAERPQTATLSGLHYTLIIGLQESTFGVVPEEGDDTTETGYGEGFGGAIVVVTTVVVVVVVPFGGPTDG